MTSDRTKVRYHFRVIFLFSHCCGICINHLSEVKFVLIYSVLFVGVYLLKMLFGRENS